MRYFTILPEGTVHNVHYVESQARHYARHIKGATIALERPKIQTVSRNYVDLALVVEILKANYPETKYAVDIQNHRLEIYYERYTMNPVGFHIGWENYTFAVPLHRKHLLERNEMVIEQYGEKAEWLCDLEDINVTCDDAPESEICACQSGDCDCDPDNHCCDEDECLCELYISPLDDDMMMDFIDDEAGCMMDDIKEVDCEWRFDQDFGWSIVIDDTPVWIPEKKLR